MADADRPDVVADYLDLGLALGRHVDGLVDAYYGPPERAARAAGEPLRAPAELEARARRLLATLDTDDSLDAHRRRYLAGQVKGLRMTAAKLAGSPVGYLDEVEACYGVRPGQVAEDDFAAAHRRLDAVLPGRGPLAGALHHLAREPGGAPRDAAPGRWRRSPRISGIAPKASFGLPDGERVDFEQVTNQPWSGFNYYLGGLHSRVVINVDLPVLSTSLGHLVAHEAYPGHHTEHSRKEVGLVRRRRQLEETIFLVGTPQCLLAEGLADLGLEVVVDQRPEAMVASHLRPLGIPYDADLVAQVSIAGDDARTRCGPTPPCSSTTRVSMSTRWSITSPGGASCRRPGPKRPCRFWPTPPGGPTSSAMSRASPSAGASSAPTRPASSV